MSHAPTMTMGEYRPPPGYPAAMTALTQTTLGPARWHATRIAAGVLALAGAVLTVVASFLPLLSAKISAGSSTEEITISAWQVTSDSVGDQGEVPANGYPLVFAALFLVVAAMLAWFAANPNAADGTHRLAGLLTTVGAAFLIGTVWTVSGQIVNGVDTVVMLGTTLPGIETEASYDVGFWLLLVAGLLGLTASVLALVPARRQPWVLAQREHAAAHVMDVPVVHRLPPELPPELPLAQPEQVDPLTGQPLAQSPYSPPGGVPQVAGNGYAASPVPASNFYAPVPETPAPAATSPVGPARGPAGQFVPAPDTEPAPEELPGPAVPPVEDPLSEPRQP